MRIGLDIGICIPMKKWVGPNFINGKARDFIEGMWGCAYLLQFLSTERNRSLFKSECHF